MFAGTPRSEQPLTEPCGRPPLLLLLGLLLSLSSAAGSDRHAVYWNSSNPRFWGGDYTVEVSINDYLDVYCPHYQEAGPAVVMETYLLYMVSYDGYLRCSPGGRGFRRWDCSRPRASSGALRFSERIQLFTPFSLGFEFRPGREYYYISSAQASLAGRPCLKLKVYVRPCNDSVYEAPEPVLTEDGAASGGPARPRPLLLPGLCLLLLLIGSDAPPA